MSSATLDVTPSSLEAEITQRSKYDSLLAVGYGIALLVSLSVWFLAVRAPLWVDETLAFWQTAGGFREIWSRSVQANYFGAYAYILWLTRTLLGDKELVLRIPSILAMLGAVYVFYRCARQLFDWDVSIIATILFILPRAIGFAAIDVRPYAFALLITNVAIFLFLRWMKTGRTLHAALFGISAAGIFYFHYLFASILVAFALCSFLSGRSSRATNWRQFGAFIGCFAITLLPVVPRLVYIYRTRTTHSFAEAPRWSSVLEVLHPGNWHLILLASVLVLAALSHRLLVPNGNSYRKLLLCASLALVPILSLYVISVTTSVHVFILRYLLEAVPGIALCWGWMFSLVDSRPLRALFCVGFVSLCVFPAYRSPASRAHDLSWKYALEYADANASEDHAPLLLCSAFVEGDYQPMPAVANDSMLFAPLSYYKVSSPVVPLPGSLNEEAKRQISLFMQKQATSPGRFLVLASPIASRVVDYLAYTSQGTHSPRVLGKFDEIWVVEFVPIPDAR